MCFLNYSVQEYVLRGTKQMRTLTRKGSKSAMYKKAGLFFLTVCLVAASMVSPVSGQEDAAKEKKPFPLSEKHKKWLEEEVVYIISEYERAVFENLPNEKTRDNFIKAFWEVRDPSPGTDRNEFKIEHYNRIKYANTFLGRETARPGWQTDRGRIFILFGKPRTEMDFPDGRFSYPIVIWHYQLPASRALPHPIFYMMFFKERGVGEFKLYSPLMDGADRLLNGTAQQQAGGDPYRKAGMLQNVNPDVAEAAYCLVPGQGGPIREDNTRGSLISENLLASIRNYPNEAWDNSYAQRFAAGAGDVDMDYMLARMSVDSIFKVLKSPEGNASLHYGIQISADQLSVGLINYEYYLALEVSGTVVDSEGRRIYELGDRIELDMDEARYQGLKSLPFFYKDKIVLLPGLYTVSLIVKDKVGKKFGRVEKKVLVPAADHAYIRISAPVLLLKKEVSDAPEEYLFTRPFAEGKTTYKPSVTGEFGRENDFYVLFQLDDPRDKFENLPEDAVVEIEILRGNESVLKMSESATTYTRAGQGVVSICQQLDITALEPGTYTLSITLKAKKEGLLDSRRHDFTLLDQKKVFSPWDYSKPHLMESDPAFDFQIGTQYLIRKEYDQAEKIMLQALKKNEKFTDAAVKLGGLYLMQGKNEKVIEVLEPRIVEDPKNLIMLIYLGRASYESNEFNDTVRYLERARMLKPMSPGDLNHLGNAYVKLEKPDKARAVFEASLEINPDQEDVRKVLEQLK